MSFIKKIFLSFLFLSIYNFTFGCLNDFYDTTNITIPKKNDSIEFYKILHAYNNPDFKNPYWQIGFFPELKTKLLREKNTFNLKNIHFKKLSDISALELKVGDKNAALSNFILLAREHPNEYIIISNLATAYEVNGMDDSALFYIKKAINLNPDSHFGSEWIHEKILESKLKKIAANEIINLKIDSKDIEDWWLNNDTIINNHSIRNLLDGIAYQLHERLSFIQEKDSIIDQLILDFSDLMVRFDRRNSPEDFYYFASDRKTNFISKNNLKLEAKYKNRLQKYEKLDNYVDSKENFITQNKSILILSSFLFFILITISIIIKSKKNKLH